MIQATVIIAAWNAETTVAQSVACGLEQINVSTEVVVADDVSTDATAKRAGDAGARVVRLSVNGGPAAARNAAIEASRGDWLAVLDSDDRMKPGRLERMIGLADDMNADVVLGNFRSLSQSETSVAEDSFLDSAEFDVPRLLDLEAYVGANQVKPGSRPLGYLKPLFRREFLNDHDLRYDTRLRNGEDCHMIFACLAAGARVVIAPWPDYLYTIRRGSISHRADPAHIAELIEADERFTATHGHALSQEVQALFASRKAALTRLMVSEDVMQSLRTRHFRKALSILLRRPEILGPVSNQLMEAVRKRAGRTQYGQN